MQIYPDKLSATLEQGLKPVYLFSGSEPLQILEAVESVREACKTQGILTREVFEVSKDFNWDEFSAGASTLSLFAESKLTELRIKGESLGKNGLSAVAEYLASPPEGDVLIITMGALKAASVKAKWYQQIDKLGVTMRLWPVDPHKLPGWIQQRAKQQGMKLSFDAAELLSQRVEGNLLAAKQDIDKLQVLFENQSVDLEQVNEFTGDNARYNVFSMIETMLMGQEQSAVRALRGMANEGTHAMPIISILAREIRKLLSIKQQVENGAPLAATLKSMRVWGNNANAITQAIPRLRLKQLEALLAHCASIDQMIKGMRQGNPWVEMEAVVLSLAGTSLTTNRFRL